MRRAPLFICIFTSIVSITAIVISGISFFVVSHNVKVSRNNLQDIAGKIILTNTDRIAVQDLSELFKQREIDINRLNNLSVNKNRPLNFIQHMEIIAHLTGSLLALRAEEVKSDPSVLLFHITADGNETGLRNLIKLIETLPYEISIDNFSFQRDPMLALGGTNKKSTAHLLLTMKVKAQ